MPSACNAVTEATPGFIIPDTVCVNTPVTISNISLNATSYYWNFNVADINSTPEGMNLGNAGGLLSKPVFMDYVFFNGNYYGFVINHYPGKLIRLNFGNSLLNAPTAVDLGNFGGVIPAGYGSEGIQVVQNEGKWYALIVGGYTVIGSTPRIVKIDFGANLLNPAPLATNWGNIGDLLFPVDLHVFKENNNWYGFTLNAENNTIVRFNFSNSFDNTPTAVNLGNLGNLDFPTGIFAINDNNDWKVFVLNRSRTNNYSITRLDFGTSLLNTPAAVNLGNPGNALKQPRDFTIMKFCGESIGFVVNEQTSDIVKLNFNKDLSSVPNATSLGNIGQIAFPHSISKFFRVGSDVYSFITNVNNNTITRLKFNGSTGSSIPNSALQSPLPVTYDAPGTYNINLTIDDGLPTQASVCKQVIVLPELEHKPTQNISICDGTSVKIGSSSNIGSYLWNTGVSTDSISVSTGGVYWVETSRYGCTNRDSFLITVDPPIIVDLGIDKTICSAADLVLDAGVVSAAYSWSTGSTDQTASINTAGTYYVTVVLNSCSATDTIIISEFASKTFDFYYKQNVCDPLTVQFSSVGDLLTGSYWDFGDGSTAVGTENPTHTYSVTGNYFVKYSINNGICADTIRKAISINIEQDNLILTADTTICYGFGKQLRTASALSFCWTPTIYLDNPNSANPITSATEDITYYFKAEVTGTDLITNGNFSQGNTGFISGYNFANSNTTEGQYFVGPNPRAWNTELSACKDHTSGNGNMMLVNGSPTADVNVWKQTITVTPNTNYAFSTWIQALWPPNPAQLQFSINGKDAGSLITASIPTCTWTQFYTTWNSGNNTTAVIAIVNKNTLVQGNDFALDDISFAPVFIKRDSVMIKVEKPIVQTNNDTSFCPGSSIQLNTIGAQNYSWSPATSLSNAGVANPLASPLVSTEYIVTGTTINGCAAKDTVNVNIYPRPVIVLSDDTTICKNALAQLSVTGGAGYSWSPTATLSNPLIANPVASPLISTMYYVTVTDVNTCEHIDSVQVAIRPDAVFSINDPVPVCRFDSVQLSASGGDIYTWEPANGLNNTGISNPWVSPSVNTEYKVTITETICNQSEMLSATVIVKPLPNVNAVKSNDIDCRNDQSQLTATGAEAYLWAPSATLSNPSINNPVATPATATQYIVTGTAVNGCSAKDTIDVNVIPKATIVVSPDALICRNAPISLFAGGGASYSWFPAATLNNNLIENPVASPDTSTVYYVTITDANNCEYLDSVKVNVRPDPVFSVSDSGKICLSDSARLSAAGGDLYSWQPANGLSNTNISNPWATPSATTEYMVTITETACNQSATLSTKLTVSPLPAIIASRSNDIDCSNDFSQLSAAGADEYSWTPATTLNNPGIRYPIATPLSTTGYIVKGTDAAGCTGYDTITVKVDNINKGGYLMPNAFTPDNDGLNDCFRIKYWGIIDDLEFSIYNRWGERLFFTRDASQCWDGTYKGVKQDGGVYIYMIKAKTACQPEVFRKGTFVLVR